MQKVFQFLERISKAKTWKKVVMSLSSVVVFVTVYALILPAITVENRTICGFEEHGHSDECYSTIATVICGQEESEDHIHTESCYSYEKQLFCVLDEHMHHDDCYVSVPQAIVEEIKETLNLEEKVEEPDVIDENEITNEETTQIEKILVCTLEHEHTEECYEKEEIEKVEEIIKEVEEFAITTQLEDGNTVSISGNTEALPEEVEDVSLLTVKATILEDEQVDELMKNITDEESASEKYTLYDISIEYDGKQIEPVGEVQLVITGAVEDPENPVEFFHIDEDHSIKELLDYIVSSDGTITADTDHFSIYGVTNSNAEGTPIEDLTQDRTLNSGTYYLSRDISTTNHFTIPANANVTFNLNGHTITYTGTSTRTTQLFIVNGNLTIIDGMEKAETVSTVEGEPYNQLATYDRNRSTLTYYVTKSDVVNSTTGQTVESLEKHLVTAAGKAVSTNGTSLVIVNNGGSFTLKSGFLTTTANERAIDARAGSTLHLDGGYIAGINSTNAGAAIMAAGNTHLTGTVIAANSSSNNGGAIYQNGGTLHISDHGVIAGNKSTAPALSTNDSNGGAGVFANGATIDMSGGYVTNNSYICGERSYGNGGAGFLIKGTSVMNLSGGYITGNYSDCGGGGIRTGRDAGKDVINMTGGYVNRNIAIETEGGGILFDRGSIGYITGGFVNNNETSSQTDWGGGGIFVADFGADSAQLYLYGALITDNNAGGYGGGIAGCSTARITLSATRGTAIYQNHASGEHLAGAGSDKHEDTNYAKNQMVFIQNGYNDYFSALSSIVSGGMLGGGTANWTGSADGVAISSTSAEDVITADYIMGTNAHPSKDDIQAAQQAATIYINGNSSYTHGGGILINGYLFAGKTIPTTYPVRFEIDGTKSLTENGEEQDISDYIFNFNITNANGEIIAIGTNADLDSSPIVGTNSINFDRRIGIDQAGTFVYYITEVKDISNHAGIIYDDTEYRLTIVTDRVVLREMTDIDGETITTYQIVAQSATLDKRSPGGSWTRVRQLTLSTNSNDSMSQISQERHAVEFSLNPSGTTSAFINQKMDNINYSVTKYWDNGIIGADHINVDLLRNGEVINTQELNANNKWTYTWTDLDVGDENGNAYGYSVKEQAVDGYFAQYTYSNGALDGSSLTIPVGDYWVPVQPNETLSTSATYAIIAKDGVHALGIENSNYTNSTSTEHFVIPISGRINGNFTVGNTTYNSIYPVSAIPNNARWAVDRYTHYTRTSYDFKNVQFDSWLSNDRTDNLLYTRTSEGSAGIMRLDNGKIEIAHNSNINDTGSDNSRTYRYIAFENGIFTASTAIANAADLYKRVTINSPIVLPPNGYTAAITNSRIEDLTFRLNIKKVSSENNHQVLKGAKFNLIDAEGTTMKFTLGSDGYYTPDVNGSEELLISNANGYIKIRELPGGTYTLREIEAPSGYGKAEDQTINLSELSNASDNGAVLEYVVEDDVFVYRIPETGGRGTTILYVVGGLLMAGAAVLLIAKKRTD